MFVKQEGHKRPLQLGVLLNLSRRKTVAPYVNVDLFGVLIRSEENKLHVQGRLKIGNFEI